jgi:hypothetical protein
LDSIATILAAADTSDFKVTLIATGAGTVTITDDAGDAINTGASTIVLETDEYVTIQTDNSEAIWNIVNRDSEDKVSKSGDTMTGDLTVINGASPKMIVIPSTTGGWPQFNIKDNLGNVRGSFFVTNDTGIASIRQFDSGGSTETTLSLTTDGNVTVSGAAPTADEQLTRKDYVLDGTYTLTNKTTTNLVQNGTATGTAIKDEDDMSSDSATHLATQQSTKAYADAIPKLIILDTPELVASSTGITPGAWNTHNSATLNTANAKKAIIKINMRATATSALALSVSSSIRKAGTSITIDQGKVAASITTTNSSHARTLTCFGESVVNLDSSFDFDYAVSASAVMALTEADVYLVGYYV